MADREELLPMVLPQCPRGHGQMDFAPAATPDQAFCGVWYRCARCLSGRLYPSAELLAANASLRARAKGLPRHDD